MFGAYGTSGMQNTNTNYTGLKGMTIGSQVNGNNGQHKQIKAGYYNKWNKW